MFSRPTIVGALAAGFGLASGVSFAPSTVLAQANSQLPPVTVEAPKQQRRPAAARPAQQRSSAARTARAPAARDHAPVPQATGLGTPASGSLTVPSTAQATPISSERPAASRSCPTRIQERPGKHRQGHLGLGAGRPDPDQMGARRPDIDPRLRAFAQLRQPRHQPVHGRHSDQHR